MNEVQFLTDNEYKKLKNNLDLTAEEEKLLDYIKTNSLTAEGIALKMNISNHRYKAVKNMIVMKILRYVAM